LVIRKFSFNIRLYSPILIIENNSAYSTNQT
jgi:hypothetical protein